MIRIPRFPGASDPTMRIDVLSHQAVHLAYATPRVIAPNFLGGRTRIGVQATTGLHGGTLGTDVDGVID